LVAVAYNGELVDRVRDALAGKPSVREVKMFGGLSFMVNEKMVVSVRGDGRLLVRADPEQADELLTAKGARPAEMGACRAMSRGWIAVAEEAIATDEAFDFWIDMALEYNDKETGQRGRQQERPR